MRIVHIVALVLFLPTVLPATDAQQGRAPSGQQKVKRGVERIWVGYLFKDREGRTRLGWEVIAMGVMAQDAHVLGDGLAKKLAPYVSRVRGDYFFWNYSWLGKASGKGLPDTPLERVPRVLLRMKGQVVRRDHRGEQSDEVPSFFGGSGTKTMVEGRVETIEFLSAEWLRAWQELITLRFDPYWSNPTEKIEDDQEEVAALAARVVPVLARMRRLSAVTEALENQAKTVGSATQAVNHFQTRIENISLRWLHRMRKKHGLEIDGLDALGKLPPTREELKQWFLTAKDKEAYIARIRTTWDGDLSGLELGYHERRGNAVTWRRIRVSEIADHWSEETFQRHRSTTREMRKANR